MGRGRVTAAQTGCGTDCRRNSLVRGLTSLPTSGNTGSTTSLLLPFCAITLSDTDYFPLNKSREVSSTRDRPEFCFGGGRSDVANEGLFPTPPTSRVHPCVEGPPNLIRLGPGPSTDLAPTPGDAPISSRPPFSVLRDRSLTPETSPTPRRSSSVLVSPEYLYTQDPIRGGDSRSG